MRSALLVFALACSATAAPSTFYVDPKGSDSNPGTQSAPFKTLSRARDAVRAAQSADGALVLLNPGDYALDASEINGTLLELDPAQDSGPGPEPIVWASTDPSNPARLVGGPVTTMSKLQSCGGQMPLSEASGAPASSASAALAAAGWRLPAGTLCLDLVAACGGNAATAKAVAGHLAPNALGQCNWARGEVVWAGQSLTLARYPNTYTQAAPSPPPPSVLPPAADRRAEEDIVHRMRTAGLERFAPRGAAGEHAAASMPPASSASPPSFPSTITMFNWTSIAHAGNDSFTTADQRPLLWQTECQASQDCWAHGMWTYGWADSYVRISSISTTGSDVNISTDPATPPVYGYKDKARWYGLSILSELDAPGEYYVDAAAGRVYILPPTGAAPTDEVAVTAAGALITTSATNAALQEHEAAGLLALRESANWATATYDEARAVWQQWWHGKAMERAAEAERKASSPSTTTTTTTPSGLQNVVFANLTLAYARTGLSFSDTNGVVLHNVRATAMTRSALSVHGSNSFMVNVDGSGCGCSPLHIGGGDEASLTPSVSALYNATALGYSRLIRTYQPGISWSGVGSSLSRAVLGFAPHQAWLGSGNNNAFTSNIVNVLCTEVTDSGAWYSGRSWAHRNQSLVSNTFANIKNLEKTVLGAPSVQAVYNDDQLSANNFIGNRFWTTHVGMFIGGGRRHQVLNNSFWNTEKTAVHIDDRGLTWQKTDCGADGMFVQELKALHYQQPPWSTAYPLLVNITQELPCVPVYNNIQGNCMSGGTASFTDFSSSDASKWHEFVQKSVPTCQ